MVTRSGPKWPRKPLYTLLTATYFSIEESKETILNFSQGTERVL